MEPRNGERESRNCDRKRQFFCSFFCPPPCVYKSGGGWQRFKDQYRALLAEANARWAERPELAAAATPRLEIGIQTSRDDWSATLTAASATSPPSTSGGGGNGDLLNLGANAAALAHQHPQWIHGVCDISR